MVGDRTGRRATGTVRSMAARLARVAGLLVLVVSTAACGTVSVEVTSETDVGKVGVQTTLALDDPPVTQTAPATTASTTTR